MPYITRSVSKKIEEQKKKAEKIVKPSHNYCTRSKVADRHTQQLLPNVQTPESIFIIEMKKFIKDFEQVVGRSNQIDQLTTMMQYLRDNKTIIEKPENLYFKLTLKNKILEFFYEDNAKIASEWNFWIFGKHLK